MSEFPPQLVEPPTIRRTKAGGLDTAQEERLGLTLGRARIGRVAADFGPTPGDLALDHGPLGRVA